MSYPNDYQSHEQLGNDDPTQLIPPYRRTNQRWLVTGGIAVAVLMFLAGAVVACGGADERGPTAAGAGPSPATASPVTASPSSATPDAAAGGGNGGGGDGGNNNGGGGGGNPGDPGDPPGNPEPPPPAPLQISAAVHGPPAQANAGCAASGTITVDGGEYPIEVTHMWFRMQPMGGGLPAHPVPFGGQQTSTVDGPGQLPVQSPAFPADAGQNQVQLRVVAPEATATGFVAYPKCAELGLSN